MRGVLTAAIVLAGLQLAPAAASATQPSWRDAGTPGCVDGRELWTVGTAAAGMSRQQLEHRWEVEGAGERVIVLGERAWAYPKCDSDALALAYFDHGGLAGVGSARERVAFPPAAARGNGRS